MNITEYAMFKKTAGKGGGGSTLPSQHKELDITENGTVEVTPDYGYTLSKVVAYVNVKGNVEFFVATSDVEIFVVTTEGAFTLQDFSAALGGSGNVAIQIVHTLPEKLIVSNVADYIYVYVVESTGTAYANFGSGNVTAGMMVFMDDAFNKGWTTDTNSVTEYGIYCVRKPTAYNVKSIDELPSNAVDGSMAIVESDSIVGKWKFNETITASNLPFEDGSIYLELHHECDMSVDGDTVRFNHLYIDEADGQVLTMEQYLIVLEEEVYAQSYYEEGWIAEHRRYMKILEDTNNTALKNWVKANAIRISGGNSLYIHENGEWVHKGEVA